VHLPSTLGTNKSSPDITFRWCETIATLISSSFAKGVLRIKEGEETNKDINLKTYLKYILKDGNVTEKREVLSCLKSRVVMTNKKLELAK